MKARRDRPEYFYARLGEEWRVVEECGRIRSKR